MARPHKATDTLRSERFELRLTIDEVHRLVTNAVHAGLSISDYIRKSALGDHAYMQKAMPDQAIMIQAVEELNRINHVLDQIVRSGKLANDPAHMALLTETLDTLKTLSGQLIKKLPS